MENGRFIIKFYYYKAIMHTSKVMKEGENRCKHMQKV